MPGFNVMAGMAASPPRSPELSQRERSRRLALRLSPPELAEEFAEDRDWYTSESVFWVPQKARWDFIKTNATSVEPTIGQLIDDAMVALENENPSLKGVLTKNYARPELDQIRLGEVIKLFSDLAFRDEHHGQDVLGRVYEYFLGQFAIAEGKRGGQFYTAGSVVRLLVEMLQPFKGRVYDPCCGSGGMFVQSERFVEAHNGNRNDVSIFGQESNPTTWRLAKMNLAIRGIEADLGPKWADSFHEDLHPGLKADFVLANPPFNDSDWGGERLRSGERWPYGVPPAGNANFAWVQHFIHHLAPHGYAGFVLANGSLSSQQSGEGDDPPGDHRGRSGGLHRQPAGPTVLHHADTGLPVVSDPRQVERSRARPEAARPSPRDAVHRRPQTWSNGDANAANAERRRCRESCRRLSRVARNRRALCRRTRLL